MVQRQILYSEEVDEFLSGLPEKARAKILYNINLVAVGVISDVLFKKLENTDIWEFRTFYAGVWYRILSFWDTSSGALIVTTHGFCKKSDRTPKKEIEKAISIRKYYFEQLKNS